MVIDFIRKIKLSYEIYNFFKKKELIHNLNHYKKYGIKKKYYSSISSRDFDHLNNEKNILDLKDSQIELPKNEDFNNLDVTTQKQLLTWSKDGYVILRNFFTIDQVDSINSEIERLIQEKKAKWRYGNKIMFANHYSKIIYQTGVNSKLMLILKILMGKEIELFQSINFITPSQQRPHSDSIHMSTFPCGNLIAAWVALENTTTENGPLHFYPGSHKLPYVMNKDFDNDYSKIFTGNKTYVDYENKIEEIILKNNLKKELFIAKAGDILIWHANLFHGGNPLINKNRTRKSMVLHYYSMDAICYHEITQRPTLKRRLSPNNHL